jgi:hypothetical protein
MTQAAASDRATQDALTLITMLRESALQMVKHGPDKLDYLQVSLPQELHGEADFLSDLQEVEASKPSHEFLARCQLMQEIEQGFAFPVAGRDDHGNLTDMQQLRLPVPEEGDLRVWTNALNKLGFDVYRVKKISTINMRYDHDTRQFFLDVPIGEMAALKEAIPLLRARDQQPDYRIQIADYQGKTRALDIGTDNTLALKEATINDSGARNQHNLHALLDALLDIEPRAENKTLQFALKGSDTGTVQAMAETLTAILSLTCPSLAKAEVNVVPLLPSPVQKVTIGPVENAAETLQEIRGTLHQIHEIIRLEVHETAPGQSIPVH